MTEDKRPGDLPGQIEAKESAILGGKGIGGDLFGPPPPPTRYRCADHGVILAADVLWRRDGNPYCPHCEKPLEKIE